MKVLHVFGNLNMGGAESRIMDLYRKIDREKVQFDFVVHSAKRGFYEDEAERLGGHIYRVPRFRIYNYFAYRKAWKQFFREHKEYAVVQGHMTSTAAIYLPVAKKAGVRTTAAHARSAGTDPGLKGMLTRFLRRNLAKKADACLACSKEAAIAVFGQQAYDAGRTVFVPNAIDCGAFAFDPEMRAAKRTVLGLNGRLVLGHVGRFHYAKNHEYLLRVFAELRKKDRQAGGKLTPVLLLLGEGPRMDEMKTYAAELGIAEDVRFLGNHTDVADFYQTMDYFLYPSRYEGLPGAVVEAQANGLPVLMSSAITADVMATDLVRTADIRKDPAGWAELIYETAGDALTLRFDEEKEKTYAERMKKAGFDAGSQAERFAKFYRTGDPGALKQRI